MLDFILKNKLIVAILSIVVVGLVVLSIVLFSYFTKEEIVVVEKEGDEHYEKDGESTGMLHSHYVEDIEDPFEETDKATVTDFILSAPDIHKGSMNEGTGAVLNNAAKNHLLISSYGRNLYTYDLKTKYPFVVEKNVTYGNLDEEFNYIIYTRSIEGGDKRDINILETKDNNRKKVGELGKDLEMNNSVFYNGMFIYVASDMLGTKKTVGVVKADAELSDSEVQKMNNTINQYDFKEFKKYKEKIYGYSQKEKAIFVLEDNNWNKKADVPTEYLTSFSVSEENVFLNYTDLETSYFSINGEQVPDLVGTINSYWLDENNMLVVLDSNLYVYKFENKELEPVLHAVNKVYVNDNRIYIQDLEENTIIKSIDILNR